MNKEDVVKFRVNSKERKRIYDKVYKSGFIFRKSGLPNTSAYLRNLALHGQMTEHVIVGVADFCKWMEEFRRVGVNFNQVTRLIHERRLWEAENIGQMTPIMDGELDNVVQSLVEFNNMKEDITQSLCDIAKSLVEIKKDLNVISR